jgi:hypothetical protein
LGFFHRTPEEKREQIYKKMIAAEKAKNLKNIESPFDLALELHNLGDPRGVEFLLSSFDRPHSVFWRANAATYLYVFVKDRRGLDWILSTLRNMDTKNDRGEFDHKILARVFEHYMFAPLVNALNEPDAETRNSVSRFVEYIATNYYAGVTDPRKIVMRNALLALVQNDVGAGEK